MNLFTKPPAGQASRRRSTFSYRRLNARATRSRLPEAAFAPDRPSALRHHGGETQTSGAHAEVGKAEGLDHGRINQNSSEDHIGAILG